MLQSKKKVIVVGGGFAGLTAGHKLIKENFDLEIIEKRSVLGGKWSAWQDEDQDWIETGLHVFFGAYQEIFDLMRELNIYESIEWKEHILTYTLADGERFDFKTIKLPSPFHLLPAVFQNHYFSLLEKFSLAKALFPILFGSQKYLAEQDQITYQTWHQKLGIADKMLKKMFLPMTLALKFLPPEKISAKIVLDVSGTFLKRNDASKIGFLKGSPEIHLTKPIADSIRQKGGQITNNLKLININLKENDLNSIESLSFQADNGEIIKKSADYYLFALPIHNLKKLIPQAWENNFDYFKGLKQIESVPVITLHLWLDRQVSGYDNILFSPDGLIPVYADLGNTSSDYKKQSAGKSRFQFVIAPAFELIDKSDEFIIEKVWQDLKSIFPDNAPQAKILKAKVVKVPQSVYWPNINTDKLRVLQKSPIDNLALAGGYTKQRFYDSMEGAVRSGNRAADVIICAENKQNWQATD